jgi:hypothetical protein
MGGGFVPFRRNARFLPVQDVSILPMITELSFIKDKVHWGAPFRFGTLEIPETDFQLVAAKMIEDQSLLLE